MVVYKVWSEKNLTPLKKNRKKWELDQDFSAVLFAEIEQEQLLHPLHKDLIICLETPRGKDTLPNTWMDLNQNLTLLWLIFFLVFKVI